MKKISLIGAILVIVLLTFSMLAIVINAGSPMWSTPEPLTTDPSTDIDPSISQDSSGKIWVFFTSDRSGTSQIWYTTSADQGTTWLSPQLFPPAQHPVGAHYIAEVSLFEDSDGRLWAAWGRWVGPSTEDIYFSTSDDLGAMWSDSQLLVSYPDVDGTPCFVEVDNEVWLVFSSWGIVGNWNIYYIKTSDGGFTWSSPQGIVVSPYRHDGASVLKDSTGNVWVAYTNLTSPYDPSTTDIWYVMTSDKGVTWSEPRMITSFGSEEGQPSIMECEGAFYVFYMNRYNPDIWYVTSEDGGMTWSLTPDRIDLDPSQDQYPNAAVIGGRVWVVWHSDRTGNWDVWMSKTALEISATVDLDPDTLNLKSNGEWITAYIELPEGYSVSDIDVFSILLNGTISVDPAAPTQIGDHDIDGIPDLMVKFDRESVIEYIEGNLGGLNPERTNPLTYQITLTVTGLLYDGTPFQGSDTIRALKFLKGQPIPN